MSKGLTRQPIVVHTTHSNRLTQGRLSAYPLIRVSEDVLDYLVHVLPAPAVGAADLEGVDVDDAQLVGQRLMGILRDAIPERAAGDVD